MTISYMFYSLLKNKNYMVFLIFYSTLSILIYSYNENENFLRTGSLSSLILFLKYINSDFKLLPAQSYYDNC